MNKISIELSIIIPTFNEGKNLENIVKTTLKEAKALTKKYEIIIINDGSTDNTKSVVRKLQRRNKSVKIHSHLYRMGFGECLKSGIKITRFRYITFIPADGQVYLRDLKNSLIAALNADIVVGYRLTKKDYTIFRHVLSSGFKAAMHILFGLSLKDYNWTQVYKKKIFKLIKPKSKGVFYLGEVIIKAIRLNYKVVEMKSVYRLRISGVSKNGNIKVAAETFIDMITMWMNLKT